MRTPSGGTIGRLTKRPDFVAAASGRRFHTERMTVQGFLRRNPDLAPGLRFGLTVTKRVGHATERNRIKRKLRAILAMAGSDHAAVKADIVIIGRRDILAARQEILVADLRQALGVVTRPRSSRPEKPKVPSLSSSQALSSSQDGERPGTSHE